jgi:hypothetical protein
MQEERDRSDCGSTCWMIGKSGPSHPPTGSGGGTRSFAPLPDPGAGWKRSNAPRPWRMRGSRLTGGSASMIFKSGSPPHPERVEGRGGCGPQVRFQNRHIWKGRPLWRRERISSGLPPHPHSARMAKMHRHAARRRRQKISARLAETGASDSTLVSLRPGLERTVRFESSPRRTGASPQGCVRSTSSSQPSSWPEQLSSQPV